MDGNESVLIDPETVVGITIRCGECSRIIHKSRPNDPDVVPATTELETHFHQWMTGHTDYEIGIDQRVVLKEIDVTITVGGDQ